MDIMGNIVQQQGFNDTPKPSLEMIYKFLAGPLISILLILMSSDPAPANVIASGGNALVSAFINFNCANNSCTGGTGSSKPLSGFGNIDTQASASIGGNQGSANASLSVSSSGNAIIFNEKVSGSTVYCGSACPPTFMAVGSASGNGSFVMDIPGSARITIEIEANILLEPGNLITDVSVMTLDASGRFIQLLSYSPPFECKFIPLCTQTATQKRDLDVVPGQKIIASASVSGSALFTSEFSGTVTYTVRIIEEEKILSKVSGDSPVQEGPINSTLSKPFIVKVTDSSGNPVSGQTVNWTITGPAGATGQSVSPASTTTGADGKAQTTVKLGNKSDTYQITATCLDCTSGSPVTFTATAKGCSGLSLDVFASSPDAAWPTMPSSNPQASHDNTAAVIPLITDPAPPGGCVVNFDVEPVSSQGHSHGVHPKDKAGTITSTCTIPEGFVTCNAPVTYTASQISGEENIAATLADTGEKASKSIFTMVPALEPLAAGQFYTLTSSTGSHPDNHYGTSTTVSNIQVIARDYFEDSDEGVRIRINDMSLIWGGMFDICGGTFNIADTCTSAPNGGHSWHRTGKSVDVEHEGVNEIVLDEIAMTHGGRRREVTKIHYEFP